jgi:hypothetical protein
MRTILALLVMVLVGIVAAPSHGFSQQCTTESWCADADTCIYEPGALFEQCVWWWTGEPFDQWKCRTEACDPYEPDKVIALAEDTRILMVAGEPTSVVRLDAEYYGIWDVCSRSLMLMAQIAADGSLVKVPPKEEHPYYSLDAWMSARTHRPTL